MRLSKILSLSSIASRSKAQELIREGKVKVNNQIIDKNVFVDINSHIEVKGVKITVDLKTKLWGIYKPKHVFCNTNENYEYEEKKRIQKSNENGETIKRVPIIEENTGKNRTLTIIHERTKRFLDTSMKETKSSNCRDQKNNRQYEIDIRNNESTSQIVLHSSNIPISREGNLSYKRNSEEEIKNSMGPSSNKYKLNMNIFDFIRKKNMLYERKNKIENYVPAHLIVINSLNSQSEGIVLFTNDGDFANNLRNVNNNILSEYLLKVHGELNNEKLQLLHTGCYIGNTHIKPLKIEIIKSYLLNNWIKVTYVENSNTDLHVLFEKFNLIIRKCKRISFGPYRSSQLSPDFFMPLKIHSTLNHLIPKITNQLVLTHPYGNITTDENKNYIFVKDYLKNSLLHNEKNTESSNV